MSTKVSNSKEVTPNVADVAAKVTEETKAAADSLTNLAASTTEEVAAKVTEETKAAADSLTNLAASTTEEVKTLLTSNQEAFKEGFEIWQGFTQTYINFVLEATQQTLGQSLAFREGMGTIAANNFKKAQALSLKERQLAVDAAELFQAQTQAPSEYAATMFLTTSKVLTTTALFSDWAAERVAKMFTSISVN